MEGFLRSSSAALKRGSEEHSGFHVVLGNEACDVDSMVSALSFAYFLFKTSGSSGRTPVPVLNIPRANFPLRTDSVFLLRESGLSQENLVFRDEVDLPGLHRVGRLALTLVDHNVLPSTDSDLEGAVVEVIDHHRLERAPSPSCPVTVETVGSCATLVAERIVQKAPEVLDRQVAQLLYGSIILDCVNMAPEAGKSLQNAKFDVSGFTTEQMLLKDMKAVSGGDLRVAISAVYMTLDAFLQRRFLQQELCEFCHKHCFDLLVAMTISFNENSEPFRQVAVYSSSTLYREEVSRALERAQNPCLSLSPMSSPYADVKAYLQGNTLASRKKLLPIIMDFLCDWEQRSTRRAGSGDSEVLEEEEEVEEEEPDDGHDSSRSSGVDEDARTPPRLVEGCPLDNGMAPISHQALLEKFRKMAAASEEVVGEEGTSEAL
ncbi:hypothetical protein ANANG_G00180820 [Anguilla anguilla]|uniref:DHHA2 domain-containing protein n=1 Tax=Anguilla anguilla TaxID=7936 RepID=A0A9D3M576_ANGAN|nr:hypothetical protein ANANG_G00180820 [Anguilla anguilla]